MQKASPPSQINRWYAAAFAVLVVCVGVAYSNIFQNAFLLDDEFLIQKNRFLLSFQNLGLIFTNSSTAGAGGVDSFYRPLQGLIYLVTYQLAELSTTAFHIPNLILHAANACLVFYLGLRLRITPIAAFAAALLWALHPMHTEAVTFMSATADTLYAFFCLLGLVTLLPDISAKNIPRTCLIFILALLSKETALVFPLLVVTCITRMDTAPRDIRSYLKTWPLWAIALVYVGLRMTVLKLDGLDFYKTENVYTQHFMVRVYTFLATLPDYLSLIFWPHDLHFDRAFPVYADIGFAPVLIGAAMFGTGTAWVIWTLCKSNPSANAQLITWALLWFGAAHVLHTGLLLPVNAFFLEHWVYLPSIGLFLVLAENVIQTLAKLPSRDMQNVCISMGLVIAGALGVATYQQNTVWSDPIRFYSNILNHESENGRVHNNIAMAYDARGDIDAAITHYERAITLNDTYAQTHYNLALVLIKKAKTTQDVKQIFTHLNRAIEINPEFFRAYDILAQLYDRTGDKENAAINRQKFLDLQKKYHQ